MRRFLCAAWWVCGVPVFLQILQIVDSNRNPGSRIGVGDMTDEEYSTFLSFYLQGPNDPEFAKRFNMLLAPPNAGFDRDEFMRYYGGFPDAPYAPPIPEEN